MKSRPIAVLILFSAMGISFVAGYFLNGFLKLRVHNRTIPPVAQIQAEYIWQTSRAYRKDHDSSPTSIKDLEDEGYISKEELQRNTQWNTYFFGPSAGSDIEDGSIAMVAVYQTHEGGQTLIFRSGVDTPTVITAQQGAAANP